MQRSDVMIHTPVCYVASTPEESARQKGNQAPGKGEQFPRKGTVSHAFEDQQWKLGMQRQEWRVYAETGRN